MCAPCPSCLCWEPLHFGTIAVENSVPAKIPPPLPQCVQWMSFRRGVTIFSIFDSKGPNWLHPPSCFDLSMTCLKAGVADSITSELILERTAVLDIYFSLAWEIQLIPFNQSTSECSKCRGIWDFAVMNCLLFSEHIISFSRTDENTVSLSEKLPA